MNIKRFRRMNEIRADKLCAELGIKRNTLSRYESGERFPRPDILLRILAVTKGQVTAEDFRAAATRTTTKRDPSNGRK